VKDLLVKRPGLKLVMMSATLDAQLFENYFKGCRCVHIPGRTHPVTDHHLDDFLHHTGIEATPSGRLIRSRGASARDPDDSDDDMGAPVSEEPVGGMVEAAVAAAAVDKGGLHYGVLEGTVMHIHRTHGPGAILVFLPGLAEISKLLQALERGAPGAFTLVPLHSGLNPSDMKRAFERPRQGTRKVIISTNIAETSLTIDDVTVVVDTGRHKEMRYDAESKMPKLTEAWVSQANARQRRGRAGRVKKGDCYFVYSKALAASLDPQPVPEMLRVPLEQIVLQVKLLNVAKGNPYRFLGAALQPPPHESIKSAVDTLVELGALKEDIEGLKEGMQELTPLGHHMGAIPADVRTSRMLLFGAILGAASATATMAALMASPPPFAAPMDKRGEADEKKRSLAIAKSDQITLLRVYYEWSSLRGGAQRAYCRENFVSERVMREVSETRRQYLSALQGLGFALEDTADDHSRRPRTLQAVLCAGLYPNVCQVKVPKQQYSDTANGAMPVAPQSHENKFFLQTDGRAFVHPSSVNFKTREFETSWVVYHKKVATTKTFLHGVTMVPPYALLLFGGKIATQHEQGTITVDGWIRFRANPKVGVLVRELRNQLDKLLLHKFDDPSLDLSTSDVVCEILDLVNSGGLE